MLHVLKKQIRDDFGNVVEEQPLNAGTNLGAMLMHAEMEGMTDNGDPYVDYDVESV